MWLADFIRGFSHVFTGFGMLFRPSLRRFVLIPLFINALLFVAIAWSGAAWFEGIIDWLLPPDAWYRFLEWLLWPLFVLTYALLLFYGFTIIGNLIGTPFNGVLSARTELLARGSTAEASAAGGLVRATALAIAAELSKIGYLLSRAIPILILFLIPGINLLAPFLWLLLGAWFLALEYLDYPLGNRGVTPKAQRGQIARHRATALGFGAGMMLIMLLPPLTLAAMPAGVIGATLLWLQLEQPTGTATRTG